MLSSYDTLYILYEMIEIIIKSCYLYFLNKYSLCSEQSTMYIALGVITESKEQKRLGIFSIVIDVILKRETHQSSKKLCKLGAA